MVHKSKQFLRALLWLPARLYEFGVRLRVVAYQTDYLKSRRLETTVISVGNVTLGGTGKSPLVEYIAKYLEAEGHRPAILTRGYGRKSRGMRVLNGPPVEPGIELTAHQDLRNPTPARGNDAASDRSNQDASYREYGDEPLMLARALPETPIIINKDRYEGGRWAEQHCGADILLMDDGYQHLRLARELNLLLIDATDPFGDFEMVPFGRLREPLYAINRADAVIITRADRPFDQAQTLGIIKHYCGDKIPVMYVYSGITRLRHLGSGEIYQSNEFGGWNVAVMCGIGSPHAFADDILQIGINIVSEHFFADHHDFSQKDMDEVIREARDKGADAILTTEKDAVRLEGLSQSEVPVYSALLEIQSDDEVRLKSLLLRTIVTRK